MKDEKELIRSATGKREQLKQKGPEAGGEITIAKEHFFSRV